MHLNARRFAAPKARRSAQSTVVAGAVPGRVVATPPTANAAPPQHRDDPNALRRESSRTASSSSSSSTNNGNGSANVTGNGSPDGAGRIPARPTSRAGLTAKERLALLEEAQSKTARALRDVQYTPYQAGAAGLVDVRMYESAVESQKRMSQKLSEANAYANYLERRVDESTQHLQELYDTLKKVGMEFGAVERMAEATAAAVRFGVDKNDSVDKVLKLCERLRTMEEAVTEQRKLFNSKVPKPVPVAWVGVANSVRLMGSFDQWTKGFELSVPDVDMSDGVYKTFEAQVPLRPGRYLVKFMVDNEWRLTGDWPTEQNELGESNNVLLVT